MTDSSTAPYEFEHGYPVSGTVERAYDASDLRRAIEAYKFFYATVATEAVMQQAKAAGAVPNKASIVMTTSPRQQFAAANADTPYAISILDLQAGPMVIELPPGALIGFVDDHNMRWVHDMGTVGADKGQGGRHLVLPPGHTGEVPEGYFVGRSRTWIVISFIRTVPLDGDFTRAISVVAEGIKIYPLAEATNPTPHAFLDVSDKTMPLPSLSWEGNLEYWRQLHTVLGVEAVPEEFRPMLGMLAQLGIKKDSPFNPGARITHILEEAAVTALAEMRLTFTASRNPTRTAWEGRMWEWYPLQLISSESGDFGVPEFLDMEFTDGYWWCGYGTSAAIGPQKVGAGSVYVGTFHDANGAHLNGGKNYTLNVPGPVPAALFWSLTVYDVDTRCMIATDQDRAAIRSLIENPTPNPDGSYHFYFGPEKPPSGDVSWIKTIPGKGWYVFVRIYGPQETTFDGTWKLNDVVEGT